MSTLSESGEQEIIRRLRGLVGSRPDVCVGIGDDVAVVRLGDEDLLLTSDPVIENVHFIPAADPEAVGHKAIGRVLSDLAAAGGRPRWALIDLVAPPHTDVAWVEALYRGATKLGAQHELLIVGGDTSQGPVREVHVFGVGVAPAGQAILRTGAQPGDGIYVTGFLGGSSLGRHLAFEPRVQEGIWLREGGWATAMIDVSDGLLLDLSRILAASGVAAELTPSQIPIAEAARKLQNGRSPLEHALRDGEDFELLFTVRANRMEAFESAWRKRFLVPVSRIGRIIAGPPAIYTPDGSSPWSGSLGYEHFR